MKTLIASLLLVLGLNVALAESPVDPSLPGFQECTDNDLRLLESATVRGDRGINNLVLEHVLPERASCMVEKPRFFHPAVCGTAITQIDTFAITTQEGSSYTIVVDSSYQSCVRMRIIPTIKRLDYRPIELTYFP